MWGSFAFSLICGFYCFAVFKIEEKPLESKAAARLVPYIIIQGNGDGFKGVLLRIASDTKLARPGGNAMNEAQAQRAGWPLI